MLERLAAVALFAMQTINVEQQCVYQDEDPHIRIVITGQSPDSISPQWSALRDLNSGHSTYIGEIGRGEPFTLVVGGQTDNHKIVLVEGGDYQVELVRGGETEKGDIFASSQFSATCNSSQSH